MRPGGPTVGHDVLNLASRLVHQWHEARDDDQIRVVLSRAADHEVMPGVLPAVSLNLVGALGLGGLFCSPDDGFGFSERDSQPSPLRCWLSCGSRRLRIGPWPTAQASGWP